MSQDYMFIILKLVHEPQNDKIALFKRKYSTNALELIEAINLELWRKHG